MATTKTRKPAAAAACCPPTGHGRARATRAFAGVFKALADETRLEMLGLLAGRRDPLCACELESHFDLAQPTVSHHLRILREAGLVTGTRRGTWVYYEVDRSALAALATFAALFDD